MARASRFYVLYGFLSHLDREPCPKYPNLSPNACNFTYDKKTLIKKLKCVFVSSPFASKHEKRVAIGSRYSRTSCRIVKLQQPRPCDVCSDFDDYKIVKYNKNCLSHRKHFYDSHIMSSFFTSELDYWSTSYEDKMYWKSYSNVNINSIEAEKKDYPIQLVMLFYFTQKIMPPSENHVKKFTILRVLVLQERNEHHQSWAIDTKKRFLVTFSAWNMQKQEQKEWNEKNEARKMK